MSFEPDNEAHEKGVEILLKELITEVKRTNWLLSEMLGDTITAQEVKDVDN